MLPHKTNTQRCKILTRKPNHLEVHQGSQWKVKVVCQIWFPKCTLCRETLRGSPDDEEEDGDDELVSL
jgi:hypothetical protein